MNRHSKQVMALLGALLSMGCGTSGTVFTVDGESVECRFSTSEGTVPDGVPGEDCSTEVSSCSDDKVYEIACASTTDEGPLTCTCKVDGEAVGTFELDAHCPAKEPKLMAGCGWSHD